MNFKNLDFKKCYGIIGLIIVASYASTLVVKCAMRSYNTITKEIDRRK